MFPNFLLGGWVGYEPSTITKKVKESDEITSFYLKPKNVDGIMDFLPGQFLSIKVPKGTLPGQEFHYVRNYSLSCAPGSGYFRMSIKREKDPKHPDGLVSNYFHDSIEEGSEVLVRLLFPCFFR